MNTQPPTTQIPQTTPISPPDLPNTPIATAIEPAPVSPPPSTTPIAPTTPIPPPNPPNNPNLPNPQSHKKLLYLGSVIVLIVSVSLLSFFFIFSKRQPKSSSRAATPSPSPSISPVSQISPISPKSSGFSSLVSNPDQSSSSSNSQPTTENTSTSQSGNPQPTTQNSQLSAPTRIIYEITANGDKFNPDQITATAGQIVALYISAVDKIYDVIIPDLGLEKTIYPGDKKFLEFQATNEGQYIFACKTCDTSAKGVITVKNEIQNPTLDKDKNSIL